MPQHGGALPPLPQNPRMHFAFTDEDLAFAHAARAWLQAHVPRAYAPHSGVASRDFALAWLRQLHAGGWSGIAWPTAYGGRGLSLERQVLWYEEYVRAGAPSPLDPTFVALNHAGPTLIACGTPEQKAFHLPRILAGEVLWCQGFSEPGAGSDLASLRTTGRVEGEHLVVNGQKIWSSFADIAEYQELLVRTEPGSQVVAGPPQDDLAPSGGGSGAARPWGRTPRHKGLSWVICDMRTPGITVRPIRNLAGATHFAEVFYDNVRIPLTNVVGALHDGWNVAMQTLGFERGTAATALQLGLSAKVEQLAHVATTSAAAQQDPALLHRLATLRAEATALRSLTYHTLFQDPATPFDGSIVRLYFAELSQKIHRLGMDLLGPEALEAGAGMDRLGPWVHEYLESYSETIAGGTAEIQRNIIGERILGLPREGSK